MSTPSTLQLLHAYRHLYRGLLHAVQYSKPARFTARDQLREAFRKGNAATFDQEKIDRTIQFFRLASQEKGLEHKIVKNLIHTRYCRVDHAATLSYRRRKQMKNEDAIRHFEKTTMLHYDMTLAMLNDTMGLCLQ